MAAAGVFVALLLVLAAASAGEQQNAGEQQDAGTDMRLPFAPPLSTPRDHFDAAGIVAIVIGAVIAVSAFALFVYICCRRRHAKPRHDDGVRRADVELAPMN